MLMLALDVQPSCTGLRMRPTGGGVGTLVGIEQEHEQSSGSISNKSDDEAGC